MYGNWNITQLFHRTNFATSAPNDREITFNTTRSNLHFSSYGQLSAKCTEWPQNNFEVKGTPYVYY